MWYNRNSVKRSAYTRGARNAKAQTGGRRGGQMKVKDNRIIAEGPNEPVPVKRKKKIASRDAHPKPRNPGGRNAES